MTTRADQPKAIKHPGSWLHAIPVLLVVFALVAACGAADPDVEDADGPLFGYVRALIDGEPWESTGHYAEATIRYGLPIFFFSAEHVDESLYSWSGGFHFSHPL